MASRKGGYDQINYRITRFNNVYRLFNIIHPKAYADLCLHISKNWDEIKHIEKNNVSGIRPRNFENGSLICWDYEEKPGHSLKNKPRLLLGKKFVVHTDISNFYPSIYSHALPWVLLGIDEAKKQKGKKNWVNKLDELIRITKRCETNGIAIRPATSNIISELLLYPIDQILINEGFEFVRFIDDYKCYCRTYEEAEKFIQILSRELEQYKLSLNIKKTHIIPLPHTGDPWRSDITTRIPSEKANKKSLSLHKTMDFIDYAISIHKKTLMRAY